MKKIIFFVFMIVIFSFSACKKSNQQILIENKDKQVITNFLNSETQKKTSTLFRNERINALIEKIDFASLKKVDNADGKVYYFLKLKSPTYSIESGKTQLLYLTEDNNQIKSATIITAKIAEISQGEIEKVLSNIKNDFNGKFDISTIYDKFLSRAVFKDGKLEGIGVLQTKNTERNAELPTYCIDWYIVTTYHYADGTSYTTYEYYTTTCGCSDPINESFGCEDASGGGGGSSTYTLVDAEAGANQLMNNAVFQKVTNLYYTVSMVSNYTYAYQFLCGWGNYWHVYGNAQMTTTKNANNSINVLSVTCSSSWSKQIPGALFLTHDIEYTNNASQQPLIINYNNTLTPESRTVQEGNLKSFCKVPGLTWVNISGTVTGTLNVSYRN
jgi:hypothetical protein